MGKIIDINKGLVKCEICEGWFNESDIYGFDDDGNQFCKICTEDFEERLGTSWIPVEE